MQKCKFVKNWLRILHQSKILLTLFRFVDTFVNSEKRIGMRVRPLCQQSQQKKSKLIENKKIKYNPHTRARAYARLYKL